MDLGDFEIQIKTFFGLEEILAKEVLQLGGKNIKTLNRAVACEGDLGFLYKANFSLRTALKILKPIFTFKVQNEKDFYQKLYDFEWEKFMNFDQTFLIDATVYSTIFTHSQYISLKMKDAIVDRFRDKKGQRPDVNHAKPDFKFHLHIQENYVTISLDSSGEPLFKRGYRNISLHAPINEVLAAGMLKLALWDGKGNFLDPMCGSGTLLIEAAMIATHIPPQILRNEFGFMKWNDYDESLWEKIKETRLNKIQEFEGKIMGYDSSMEAILAAKKNIETIGLEEYIELKKIDFFTTKKEISPLLLVFNPPYDERLHITQDDFYKKIGDTLKTSYPNTFSWFISSDISAEKNIGLKPSKKIKLFNGNLECRFLRYDIYEGSKKAKFSL